MPTAARLFRWDDIPKERLNDKLDRRLVTGERIMLTHVYLKKDCLVPLHHHENEQFSYILEGALRFWLGADEKEELVVRAGEVLTIPSNLPHKALALEDSLSVDVFCPPRQDWLDGTDAYLRNAGGLGGRHRSPPRFAGPSALCPFLCCDQHRDLVGPRVDEVEPDAAVLRLGHRRPGSSSS